MRITANIATHPARAKLILATVDSLAPQVDLINICFNQYDEVPGWVNSYDNINAFIPEKDLKAGGKWSFLDDEEGYYLTCDDDIIYPPNYASYMTDLLNIHGHRSVIGFDGTMLTGRKITAKFPFNKGNPNHRFVHLLGSGTIGADVETIKGFKPKVRYADIDFAKFCIENDIAQLCPVRAPGWLKQQPGHWETSVQKSDGHLKKLRRVIQKIEPFVLHTYNYPGPHEFGGWSISYDLFLRLLREVPKGAALCEFGSGHVTAILANFYDIVSIEDDERYLTPFSDFCPLKNGWYSLDKLPNEVRTAAAYLVDGPRGDRKGILGHLELLNPDAVIFVDDTHRPDDLKLAQKLAEATGKNIELVEGREKSFAVIK